MQYGEEKMQNSDFEGYFSTIWTDKCCLQYIIASEALGDKFLHSGNVDMSSI